MAMKVEGLRLYQRKMAFGKIKYSKVGRAEFSDVVCRFDPLCRNYTYQGLGSRKYKVLTNCYTYTSTQAKYTGNKIYSKHKRRRLCLQWAFCSILVYVSAVSVKRLKIIGAEVLRSRWHNNTKKQRG